MHVYKDGTARYVFYDPENGNTDDKKITWKYLRRNGTGHAQYKLNFHDKNISAPVILTVAQECIILTSEDKNWNRQILYSNLSPVDLDEFLANGGTSNDYECRPADDGSTAESTDENTDPAGDGISESDAKQRLRDRGVATDDLIGTRCQNCWTFRTSDMPFGTNEYTVLDTGEAFGKGLGPDENSSSHKSPRPVGADTPSANY